MSDTILLVRLVVEEDDDGPPLYSGGDMMEPREVTEVKLELLLRRSLRSSLGEAAMTESLKFTSCYFPASRIKYFQRR